MSFSSETAGSNQLIESVNLPSLEDKSLFEDRLEDLLRKMSTVINTKEGGVYDLTEKVTFKRYFTTGDPLNFINVYRTCFDLINLNGGNIAGGASFSTAHNISNLDDAILIYVSCVTTTNEYFTAVYPDVYLTATTIEFTNPNAAAVSSAIVVAEYTKA